MIGSQERAAFILQVRSGQLTAKQAARQLGISRQRYYQWERRALQAMLQALETKPQGRHPKPKADPVKVALQLQVRQLESRLHQYEQKEKLRAELKKLEEGRWSSSGKKNPR
jgi:transposase